MPDDLRADCERCFALCCVAPAFSASADFAVSKAAGQACPNLGADFRCGIHARLRARGFPGCAVYDCLGAGQKVAQVTFGGRDWRRTPEIAGQMFRVFTIMRELHELLWHLGQALALAPARPLHGELRLAFEETERLTRASPDALEQLDLAACWRDVGALLRRASELARAGLPGADLSGADLIGRDLKDAGLRGTGLRGTGLRGAGPRGAGLRGAGLRGARLRGARLIGADLRGADLTAADLTGADLRGADLSGADLTGSLFVTQSQLDAARGDAATRLPPGLARPSHWPQSGLTPGRARPSRPAATSRPAGP